MLQDTLQGGARHRIIGLVNVHRCQEEWYFVLFTVFDHRHDGRDCSRGRSMGAEAMLFGRVQLRDKFIQP